MARSWAESASMVALTLIAITLAINLAHGTAGQWLATKFAQPPPSGGTTPSAPSIAPGAAAAAAAGAAAVSGQAGIPDAGAAAAAGAAAVSAQGGVSIPAAGLAAGAPGPPPLSSSSRSRLVR